jgi:hemoglobin-like flavoprotein
MRGEAIGTNGAEAPFMALDATLLRNGFALIAERAPNVTHRFYEILFERRPEVRSMFGRTPQAQARQEKMLTQALVAVLDHLEDAPWLEETLFALGGRHVGYGVRDEMYAWVAEALLATFAEVAGPDWTPALAEAWSEALGAIASLMLAGARAARGELALASPGSPHDVVGARAQDAASVRRDVEVPAVPRHAAEPARDRPSADVGPGSARA